MKWWRLLFDLCFPKICAVCGRALLYHEQHFCLECLADMPLTYFWNMEENPAERALWGRCRIERVHSLFYYNDTWRKPVHLLKYNGNTAVGKHLGKMLGEKIASTSGTQPVDYIVPVPLHWRKKWKRGYNQAEIVARGLCQALPCNCRVLPNLLRRKAFTGTQTARSREERWNNVANAFELNPHCKKRPPAGSHIILLDDVFTTGATLEACASILVEQLGCRVSIATLAYVE